MPEKVASSAASQEVGEEVSSIHARCSGVNFVLDQNGSSSSSILSDKNSVAWQIENVTQL